MRNFELEVFFSEWEFKAKHHLTASDVESMSLEDLLDMAGEEDRAHFKDCWLGYTQTWGDIELLDLISGTYDFLSAQHILCFAGAEEGIYTAMRVLLDKDDHAIVVVPNYQAAETIPLEICKVSGVPLRVEHNWRLDIDDVAQAIRPNTKLVSINFPNNPTGAILPEEDLKGLIELCRNHGIYLFSDEVYRLLELDDSKRIQQVADLYEKGISLNVMSKAYGLPGLRIGWLACQERELLLRFERYKHYLSICNAGPSESLAKIALKNRETILQRNRGLLGQNLKELDDFFLQYPDLFEWAHPDGGCVAYPRYTGRGSVESFCKSLVNQYGVLLLPASIYRSELLESPLDRFRVGFGRKGIREGLQAFRTFMDDNYSELKK
jgi:aspartate/methionine/tyrosine aminotransferase